MKAKEKKARGKIKHHHKSKITAPIRTVLSSCSHVDPVKKELFYFPNDTQEKNLHDHTFMQLQQTGKCYGPINFLFFSTGTYLLSPLFNSAYLIFSTECSHHDVINEG